LFNGKELFGALFGKNIGIEMRDELYKEIKKT
jgi:hypothetical protein